MPLIVSRAGLELPSAAEVAALRARFDAVHCVLLPGFLEPALVRALQRRVAAGSWRTIVHSTITPPAIDLRLQDEVADGVIAGLLNDRALFGCVEAVTGCEPIGSVDSRVYRMDPGVHTDTWHGDDDGNRMVTLSVNLGSPFEGGGLALRDRWTHRPIHHVQNTGFGDAILFRIRDDLEHRVEEVSGATSKYAIAGWFRREPRADLGRLVRWDAS